MSKDAQVDDKKINEKPDYVPRRFGLSYEPPQIIIEYYKPSSDKLYHHKIKLYNINQKKISDLIDEIYKKHSCYLVHNNVSKAQIIQLVEKLREKYIKILKQKEENDLKVQEEKYNFDTNEDLNKLSKEEIDKKKKLMDVFYDKNNIKAGDANFQYDIRKDFNNEGVGEWDDDDF